MVHHRFDVLKMLLADLDDQENNIFLRIDQETKNAQIDELRQCVWFSNLYFCGSYTRLLGTFFADQCVLNLLKAAIDHAHYDYYHLVVGVEFPLMSHEKILRFFLENQGKEFIGFDKNQGGGASF